ncbi:MAG: flagellar motor switch protein FliG [Deltaproteobacteria bacterium]|nr:MAG: flagellar motor switch protein FliG [Deltaproteobacteria bacterium]
MAESKGGGTSSRKAAVFLLLMGEEFTTDLFLQMNDKEIRSAANAMADIDEITPEEMEEVLNDFVEAFGEETSLYIEGQSFLKKVLEKTEGSEKAVSLLKELEEERKGKPFDWSRKVNLATLTSYVKAEHPQTIAMILAHLPPEVSSDILTGIDDDRKGDIAFRLAQLGQVSEDVVRDVDEALKTEIKTSGGGRGGKTGGVKVLVDILNGVDKSTEDIIMEIIEQEDSDMAQEIKDLMFVFEDLLNVDDRAMREILKKVEGQQLTLSLKTASEEMKEKILGNLSSRAAEMLLDDIESMGPVKLSDVEAAQQEIVGAAKELEAEGTITLGKGKGEELV